MNQPTEGKVLFVGEGNFSLSSSLVSTGILAGPQVISSAPDTCSIIQEAHSLAAANIDFLEKSGATVLFEVDARELHNIPEITFFDFSRVIFNFPLANRHNIKKNRELLSDFFSSVVHILEPRKGQVMVTLCKGQGGTPADQPMRSWHDSWQVVSMASNAGLILTQICDFQADMFPGYQSVGFRFQDKGFNVDGALTHIFEKARPVTIPDWSAQGRCSIQQDEESYTVPRYIKHKLESCSLLDKECHPMFILRQHIEQRFHSHKPISILPCNSHNLPKVLLGCKSTLQLASAAIPSTLTCRDQEEEMLPSDNEVNSEDIFPERVSSVKDVKDLQNRSFAVMQTVGQFSYGKAANLETDIRNEIKLSEINACGDAFDSKTTRNVFAHGVDQGNGAHLINLDKSENVGAVQSATDATSELRHLSYPVFVVRKMHSSLNLAQVCEEICVTNDSNSDSGGDGINSLTTKKLKLDQFSVSDALNSSATLHDSPMSSIATLHDSPMSSIATLHDSPMNSIATLHDSPMNSIATLHDSPMNSIATLQDNPMNNDATLQNNTVHSDATPNANTDETDNCLYHLRLSLIENLPHLNSYIKEKLCAGQTAVMSGVVFHKSSINPTELPISHEMLVLTQSPDISVDDLGNVLAAGLREMVNIEAANIVVTKISSSQVILSESGTTTVLLQIKDTGTSTVFGHVFRFESLQVCLVEQDSAVTAEADLSSSSSSNFSQKSLGAILYLDKILLHATQLTDVRLLWSENPHFIEQFQAGQTALPIFKQFSLYPVRFVHDISFWESQDRIFEEEDFFTVIRDIALDTVTNVMMIDKYQNADTTKTSRCYRLVFQSHDQVLSYITSWKLQSMIRLNVSQSLGVELR